MKAQLVTDHVRVQVDTHGPDMSELLRDIRSQYESAAKKNREEAEAWYNSKVSTKTNLRMALKFGLITTKLA